MRRSLTTHRTQVALVVLAIASAVVVTFALLSSHGAGQPGARESARPAAGIDATGTASAETTVADAEPSAPATPAVDITVAWQPSHQADTGADGWQEYVICGDIADRTMALMPDWTHVKAWELGLGLTGSNSYRPQPTNTPAFDAEIAAANTAQADVFVAIHNDGGAPSGVLGIYLPGDAEGRALAESLVASLVQGTGLPSRGVTEMRLYSLEPERNAARYRCLVEIGDNSADRAYLESPLGRQQIAAALASGMCSHFGEAP